VGGGGGASLERELEELEELDPEDDVLPELELDEPELDEPELEDPDDELDDEPPLRGTACWADAHAGVAIVRPRTRIVMRVELGMVAPRVQWTPAQALSATLLPTSASRKCHNLGGRPLLSVPRS